MRRPKAGSYSAGVANRAELHLPAQSTSVPEARLFVRESLASWGLDAMVEAAVLVVSELATNAVLHARTELVVRLAVNEAGGLRIEVVDAAEGHPRVRGHSASATTGRGLSIVEGLAREWGVEPAGPGPGKTVWAELTAGDEVSQETEVDTGRAGPVRGPHRRFPSVDDTVLRGRSVA